MHVPADGQRAAHVIGVVAVGLQVAVVRGGQHLVVDRGERGAGNERDGRRGHTHGVERPPVSVVCVM